MNLKGNFIIALFVFPLMQNPLISKEKTNNQFPHYSFDVSYNHDKTLLIGKMQVRFYRKNYPKNELLFSLPGNRFLSPDNRGLRKHKIVPVFSMHRFRNNIEDPKLPKGFSYGYLKIQAVRTYLKESSKVSIDLDYKLDPNFELEIGYSTNQGILRIFLPDNLKDLEEFPGKSMIEIEFSTKFPEHLFDGLTNEILLTSNWHPKLLNWIKSPTSSIFSWEKRGNIPSPGIFEINFKAIQSGKLITTLGSFNLLAGESRKLGMFYKPLKSFPLYFSKIRKNLIFKEETEIFLENYFSEGIKKQKIISFYYAGQKRKAELFLNWGKSYIKFIELRYGIILPWREIMIIPIHAEFEQVEVINNFVLVPIPNYKRSKFLDRQSFGFLTRSMGQLLFGESIWNNQDHQLWLNLGIPAFLGLRYFQYKFGKEAGIFDTIDWLNPRYKDHYFEKMINNIPPKMNYPIISSFRKNPDSQNFLKTLTYKTAVVISMLEYFLGNKVFREGFQSFSREFNQKIVGIKEFQSSFEKYNHFPLRDSIFLGLDQYQAEGMGSLDWFFSQWFKSKNTLDYSFHELTSRKLPNGFFETEIGLKKNGQAKMPIEIALTTQDGNELRKVVSGNKEEEKVFFLTEISPEKVSIDPDEKLMESSRINNHSSSFYRVRFVYDWKKDREHLVLIVPGLGNNAIDGNSIGLGVRYGFENYRIFAIPGYGTKNNRFLYIFNFDRRNLGLHGLEAGFSFYEYGGVKSQGLRATFEPSRNPDEFRYKFHSRFSHEKLFPSDGNSQNDEYSETGESNSLLLDYTFNFSLNDYYEMTLNLWNEQPALSLPSDFSYVRGQTKIGQVLRVGHRKSIELDIIRSSTSGDSPIQKKFQLGGPNSLRGYPQKKDLSDDNLLASRLDFKFPLIGSGFWGIVSTFRVQGTVFFDQGKIWSDLIPFKERKFRQSAGMGIEWTVDTVSLFQIPLKLEIAFPINDKIYKKPQFIFLGVITGS